LHFLIYIKAIFYFIIQQIKIIDKLLKDNEKLVDTAQLSLFDENKPEGLPAIDRTNETCD
jgi:hypothetical protein